MGSSVWRRRQPLELAGVKEPHRGDGLNASNSPVNIYPPLGAPFRGSLGAAAPRDKNSLQSPFRSAGYNAKLSS